MKRLFILLIAVVALLGAGMATPAFATCEIGTFTACPDPSPCTKGWCQDNGWCDGNGTAVSGNCSAGNCWCVCTCPG